MRDRPLLYLCLVIAAAVILSVLLGGERFIRELRPSALEKNISEGESGIVRGQVYRIWKRMRSDTREKKIKNSQFKKSQFKKS